MMDANYEIPIMYSKCNNKRSYKNITIVGSSHMIFSLNLTDQEIDYLNKIEKNFKSVKILKPQDFKTYHGIIPSRIENEYVQKKYITHSVKENITDIAVISIFLTFDSNGNYIIKINIFDPSNKNVIDDTVVTTYDDEGYVFEINWIRDNPTGGNYLSYRQKYIYYKNKYLQLKNTI